MSDGASERLLKVLPLSIRRSTDARVSRPLVALLMLLSAGGYAALAQPLRATDVFEKAAPSVVVVRSESPNKVQGSGVILSASTKTDSMTVATNAHVVGNAGEVTVETKGKRVTGRVLYRDASHDMAIVEAPLIGREANSAFAFAPPVGETVYAIGNPFGLENSITEGIVSGVRTHGALSLIQTSAAISPGSSGGGLFTGDGRLVGITSSRVLAGENIGFAIHIDHYGDVMGAMLARQWIAALVEEDTDKEPIEKENILRSLKSDRFTTWLAFRDEKTGETGLRGLLPRRLWLILYEQLERSAKSGNEEDATVFVNRARKAVEDFLASEARSQVPPPPPSRGHDSPQFVLVCRMDSAGGREPGRSFSFHVNVATATVNGHPARISDRGIAFTMNSMNVTIDRYSGQIFIRPDKDRDITLRGTCRRTTERQF